MDHETKAAIRETSRRRMREIWERSGADEALLDDEERRLLEAMRLHPEYYQLWDRLDELSNDELEQDGVNPVLHITLHQIVEAQIADGDPPETAETLNRLMTQGTARHDAVHQIGAVVTEELYTMLKDRREFNSAQYVKKLGRLGKQRRKFKGRRKGRN